MPQAWSFVGIRHTGFGAGSTGATVALPPEVRHNDLMFLVAACFDLERSRITISDPTFGTWTLLESEAFDDGTSYEVGYKIWSKRASGSEPASYSVSFSVPSGNVDGGILILAVFRNVGDLRAFTEARQASTGTIHSLSTAAGSVADDLHIYLMIGEAVTGSAHQDDIQYTPVSSGLVEHLDHTGRQWAFLGSKNANGGAETLRVDSATAQLHKLYSFTFRGIVVGEASLQGVGTLSSTGSFVRGGLSSLQGVGTLSSEAVLIRGEQAFLQGVGTLEPEGSVVAIGQAMLQGAGRLIIEAEGAPSRDFTRFDAYIDTPTESRGLLFYDELQPETTARRLQPVRTDVGDNPEEMRPDFGNFFGQADWHRGMGQRYFHRPGRDPAKFFWSEGFDVSEPGRLRHLRAVGQALASTTIGALAQAGGLPFVADGTVVRRGNGNFPGTWTAEDPHAGETPATTVEDLTAEGARLFAALGNNGVHVRSSGGTWSHYKPDGTTNLAISPATRVAWVKDRLMVVGGTDSRSIYEVTSSSSPPPVETLPEGWRFEHIFEAGGFIHACAINTAAGLSRVHHYGLNSSGTALEKKSSTPLPKDQICFSGAGYLGLAFLGVGRRNADGGYDPILYRATIRSDTGELDYVEVREEAGSGTADLGVRAIAPLGETVLVGWSLGSGAFGGARDGLAIYHFGRDSFAHHLRTSGGGGARRVVDILPFAGRVLFSLAGGGLYYEDLATYVGSAQLVSSLADFGSAGLKIWDRLELAHEPLPSGTSVKFEYATTPQENATWTEAFTSGTAGSEGTSVRLSGVRARFFAVRLDSLAQPGAAPVILGFSVRANPSPQQPEYQLVRYVRLLSRDRRDERAELVYQDPRELLRWLQDRLWTFVDFHEPGFSWTAWVEDVSTVEPAQPLYDSTSGEPLRDAFVVRLVMTGVR